MIMYTNYHVDIDNIYAFILAVPMDLQKLKSKL